MLRIGILIYAFATLSLIGCAERETVDEPVEIINKSAPLGDEEEISQERELNALEDRVSAIREEVKNKERDVNLESRVKIKLDELIQKHPNSSMFESMVIDMFYCSKDACIIDVSCDSNEQIDGLSGELRRSNRQGGIFRDYGVGMIFVDRNKLKATLRIRPKVITVVEGE